MGLGLKDLVSVWEMSYRGVGGRRDVRFEVASGLTGVRHGPFSAYQIERRPRGASQAIASSHICLGPICPVPLPGPLSQRARSLWELAIACDAPRQRRSIGQALNIYSHALKGLTRPLPLRTPY